LATNAVLHSNSRSASGAFTVRAVLRPGDHVHIEVQDNGGPWAPEPSDPNRGHGLDIIRALATDWGIVGDQTSRSIWARFDWPSP
jgi:anti-sigma regulatory factor (Ser/Thr protein kinase)